MNYTDLIIRLREKMVLSQVEFANRLGVSFQTVNRWENGHHEPTFKYKRKILALCGKYGIDTEGETNG